MKIGEAIETMEAGKKVARKGWNGKGMFLYLVPAASYPAQTEAAKEHFGELVPYAPYIAMKTAQGYVVPWLASQTDLLADDYEEYEEVTETEKHRLAMIENSKLRMEFERLKDEPLPIIDPDWTEDKDPIKEIIESLSFVRSI